MKKYLVLLTVLLSFISIKNVDAKNTYTQLSNGNYKFCINNKCETVSSKSDIGKISGDKIIRNGVTYTKATSSSSSGSSSSSSSSSGSSSFGSNNPCVKLKSPLKFIGYILLMVKIIIPLLLIIFGVMDLFRAVTGGKDGDIGKSVKTLVFRLIGGVAIFFVPTIISFIFSLVDGFDDVQSDFDVCQKCILNVSKC